MSNYTVSTTIDSERCTGCGLCVRVCPQETIELIEGKAKVTGKESLNCGHCAAVCPVGAITVGDIDQPDFETFTADHKWLPYGKFDIVKLVRLMQSRRSCRNYTDDPVDRKLLTDLARIGTTAPSGTNSQKWTFTILSEREDVLALGNQIAGFFKKLNLIAGNKWLRKAFGILGKKGLEAYYRDYYEKVDEKLTEWEKTGKDMLFHGAPALIIVGMSPGATCPVEDALLATQNILLAAHSMGLGTCLIGFAVEAMKNDPAIKRYLGIPAEERVCSVITVGYPNEKYQQVAGRKKIELRFP